MKGKLIVLDGADGVGKATQTALLVERLKKEGKKVHTLDFPQYEHNLMGKLIGECLAGKRGDFVHVDPYIGSVLYATDRYETRDKINMWLTSGHTVVLDRYVSANQIHQGGKVLVARERTQFLDWLDRLEYGVFGLPRAHLTLYLAMPLSHSLRLLEEKRAGQKKTYIATSTDTVEKDIAYLTNSRKSAESLMKTHKQWIKIDCTNKKTILTREVIHAKIWDAVQTYI